MTRTEYNKARRLIRDNGRFALKWLAPNVRGTMEALTWGQAKDRLAEREEIVSYCKRFGIRCNPRQTA